MCCFTMFDFSNPPTLGVKACWVRGVVFMLWEVSFSCVYLISGMKPLWNVYVHTKNLCVQFFTFQCGCIWELCRLQYSRQILIYSANNVSCKTVLCFPFVKHSTSMQKSLFPPTHNATLQLTSIYIWIIRNFLYWN